MEIITSIKIQAKVDEVWNVLMDFEKHSTWNPFIRSIAGIPSVGNRINIHLGPANTKGMKFQPIVEIFEANKIFQWQGHLFIKGLFDGQHRFELKAIDEQNTLLMHSEKFKGLLVPIFKKSLEQDTRLGFEQMNIALKERVENKNY